MSGASRWLEALSAGVPEDWEIMVPGGDLTIRTDEPAATASAQVCAAVTQSARAYAPL